MILIYLTADGVAYSAADGTALVVGTASTIIDALITNRTQADVAALSALFDKAKAGTLTAQELAILVRADHKGAYNHTDINRVEEAMRYLDERLRGYGYHSGYVPSGIVWTAQDVPTAEQMAQYLDNVRRLRGVLSVFPTTPSAPGDMDGLTVEEANAIERILVDIDNLLIKMPHAFRHAGVTVCGIEGGLIA